MPKQPQRIPISNKKTINQENVPKPKTYSQVVAGKPAKSGEYKPNQTNYSSVDTMLQQILEKLNKMDERISKLEYRAQGAIPKSRND